MNWISVRNSPTDTAPVSATCWRSTTMPALHMQIDRDAIFGDGGHVAQFVILRLCCARAAAPFRIGMLDIRDGRR